MTNDHEGLRDPTIGTGNPYESPRTASARSGQDGQLSKLAEISFRLGLIVVCTVVGAIPGAFLLRGVLNGPDNGGDMRGAAVGGLIGLAIGLGLRAWLVWRRGGEEAPTSNH
jgi:hypothetical protein